MLTKRTPKAKVSESSTYRMEADTVTSVPEIEKQVKKEIKERAMKPVYPFSLKVSFRKRSDCERFAKLIHAKIKITDKEVQFKRSSKVEGSFSGESKAKPHKKGISDFHSAHWKGMPEFEQEDSVWTYHSVKVVIQSPTDYAAFTGLVRQTLSETTKSIYYPQWTPEKARHKKWVSSLPAKELVPRYPIYIVSKGRAHSRLTVASRMIIRTLYKQMRMRSVPVFHGPHWGFALERRLG